MTNAQTAAVVSTIVLTGEAAAEWFAKNAAAILITLAVTATLLMIAYTFTRETKGNRPDHGQLPHTNICP